MLDAAQIAARCNGFPDSSLPLRASGWWRSWILAKTCFGGWCVRSPRTSRVRSWTTTRIRPSGCPCSCPGTRPPRWRGFIPGGTEAAIHAGLRDLVDGLFLRLAAVGRGEFAAG